VPLVNGLNWKSVGLTVSVSAMITQRPVKTSLRICDMWCLALEPGDRDSTACLLCSLRTIRLSL
jgi:hypothetical protein